MKNLSEALGEFDKKFVLQFQHGFEYNPEEMKMFLKSTLISLLDEVVPEHEMKVLENVDEMNGYALCRQELIQKINEIKK